MNIGKSIRKFRRNMRAISPVIATLLMIAIAVVASLVTYAWVMGYMNFTTEKTGKALLVQSVTNAYAEGTTAPYSTEFTIYVQNVGDSDVQFLADQGVYINGVPADADTITLDANQGGFIKTTETGVFKAKATIDLGVYPITIKITSADGTVTQITKQFTIEKAPVVP